MWKWIRLRGRRQRERDLQAEIKAHIETEVQQRIERGDSPDKARALAIRDFGNPALVREITRETWGAHWIDTVASDLRAAFRGAVHDPSFAATVVFILAVTIALNATVFSLVNTVLVRPLYPEEEQVVGFAFPDRDTGRTVNGVAPGLLRDLQQSGAFDDVAVSVGALQNWTGDSEPEQLRGILVSRAFFSVLRVQPLLGRTFAPDEHATGVEAVVVLSHSLWQRRFRADPDIIGRTAVLDGTVHSIIGVMPRGFVPAGATDAEFFLPRVFDPAEFDLHGTSAYSPVARLRNDVPMEASQVLMDDLALRLEARYPESNGGLGIRLVPIADHVDWEYRRTLAFLQVAALLVLLIGSAHLAHLFLARASRRRHELQIRMALGAGSWRLGRQTLIEGLAFAAAGGLLGLMVTTWAIRLAPLLMPDVPRIHTIGVDETVVAFTGLAVIFSGMLSAAAAAADAARQRVFGDVDIGRTVIVGWKRSSRGAWFVGSEVALTLVLLVFAGLSIHSLARLVSVAPGFRADGVLTATVRPPAATYEDRAALAAFYDGLLGRVRAMAGVESASMSNYLPMSGRLGSPVTVTAESRSVESRRQVVATDYFRSLSIPIRLGRSFNPADGEGQPTVVVSETLARDLWGEAVPVGRTLAFTAGTESVEATVIGVAGDVRETPWMQDGAKVYLLLEQDPRLAPYVSVLVSSSLPMDQLANAMRRAIGEIEPSQPLTEMASYEARIRGSYSSLTVRTGVLTGFALSAIGLAAFGIYALVSFAVGGRAREIALRMALGAGTGEVLRLVMVDMAAPVIMGLAAGIGAAAAVATFARSQLSLSLFEIQATDLTTYATVTLLLTGVAVLAAYVPARRATRLEAAALLRRA